MRARGCLHATPCRTGHGTAGLDPAWPSRTAPVGASGGSRGLLGSRQSPSPRLVGTHPEPGPLPSTGVTQLPRYYGPLRRLPRPSKNPRIGVLNVGGGAGSILDPFFQGLRDLGWGEGRNVVIERRNAEGHEERLPGLAAELINLKVDVILAAGGPAALKAARDATKTIPIVMVASSRDPIGTGLIKSYAHPGGNITGIVTAPEELTGKQLEFLRAAAPGLSRVGVLWDATAGPFRLQKETAEAAQSLGVELLPFEVLEPAGLDGAFNAAAKARVGGLIFGGSPMFVRNRRQIA